MFTELTKDTLISLVVDGADIYVRFPLGETEHGTVSSGTFATVAFNKDQTIETNSTFITDSESNEYYKVVGARPKRIG